MREKLNIENNVFKVVPQVLPVTNVNQLKNSVSPELIISSFTIPILLHELYRGRIPIAEKDAPLRKSKIGTNIFSDLKFSDVNNTVHVPVDTVLFSVHQAKDIVRTHVPGRNGRIKEFIGEDDFEINIKGVICGDNGVYPWDEVKNLLYFLRYEQSLGVVSKFLNDLFDINEVVVYDYKFEQSEGSQSYQRFEIDCWSEKPVEVLIQEGK